MPTALHGGPQQASGSVCSRRHRRSGRGAIIALLIGLTAVSEAPAQDATLVKVNKVQQGPVTQTLPVLGRAIARESGAVAASVSGPVAEIQVQVGDRLDAGDVIAILVDDRRRAEVARREADSALQRARVRTATARLNLARQERDRLAKLKGTAAFPKARFEDKRQETVRYNSELAEAQAGLDRAQADRQIAEIELARTTVRAPFSGVVTMRHTSAGAYLRVGDPVVTMINDSDLEIEVEIPTDRLAGIRRGSELDIELTNGERYRAAVRAIVPNENPLTRTRQVRLSPQFERPKALADNQSVTVHVPSGMREDVVSVHKDAVISRRGKRLVYVVKEDSAEARPVELGEAVGGRFVVLNGLKPGELVVVRGNERLRPGQKIRYELGS
ncbi:MAG: efflux RND transporter periplasmic adaptor subunit [Pseudomonadota bacterium]